MKIRFQLFSLTLSDQSVPQKFLFDNSYPIPLTELFFEHHCFSQVIQQIVFSQVILTSHIFAGHSDKSYFRRSFQQIVFSQVILTNHIFAGHSDKSYFRRSS